MAELFAHHGWAIAAGVGAITQLLLVVWLFRTMTDVRRLRRDNRRRRRTYRGMPSSEREDHHPPL